jgi:hypothetical protein
MGHLVYCDDKEKILEIIKNRTKTMIARGAAGRKIPHSRVSNGETLYFIEKGSKTISEMAAVAHVENYVKLSNQDITTILNDNQSKLNLSSSRKNDGIKVFMFN